MTGGSVGGRYRHLKIAGLNAILVCALLGVVLVTGAQARSVDDIKKAGVLRHLGIPYANFVTGTGDGMDVELMQRFAAHLGVRYEYIRTDWENIFGDLTGKSVSVKDGQAVVGNAVSIRGDVAANGITILPWREQVVDFSIPTFPNQIWLMARGDSKVAPITPTGDITKDVEATRGALHSKTVLSKMGTCLDHTLYQIAETGAKLRLFAGGLNEMAPALLNKDADYSLLDVPDALVALGKWPGQLKVIGPLSPPQQMGAAFAKDSAQLRDAFNDFLKASLRDGSFMRLVQRYYPYVLDYYPGFFDKVDAKH